MSDEPSAHHESPDFVGFVEALRAAAEVHASAGIVAARDRFLAQMPPVESHPGDPTHAYAAARIEGAIALLDAFVAASGGTST